MLTNSTKNGAVPPAAISLIATWMSVGSGRVCRVTSSAPNTTSSSAGPPPPLGHVTCMLGKPEAWIRIYPTSIRVTLSNPIVSPANPLRLSFDAQEYWYMLGSGVVPSAGQIFANESLTPLNNGSPPPAALFGSCNSRTQ